jgi:hypothetical protein
MWDDHARLVDRVVRGFPQRRAEVAPQPLVEYGGRLVPIGTAESPIDLTDSSDDIVPDLEAGKEIVNLTKEEVAQARDVSYRGEVTFHTEVEAAHWDPAPEHEPAPEYTESKQIDFLVPLTCVKYNDKKNNKCEHKRK